VGCGCGVGVVGFGCVPVLFVVGGGCGGCTADVWRRPVSLPSRQTAMSYPQIDRTIRAYRTVSNCHVFQNHRFCPALPACRCTPRTARLAGFSASRTAPTPLMTTACTGTGPQPVEEQLSCNKTWLCGAFFDFVCLPTRSEGPHGGASYACRHANVSEVPATHGV